MSALCPLSHEEDNAKKYHEVKEGERERKRSIIDCSVSWQWQDGNYQFLLGTERSMRCPIWIWSIFYEQGLELELEEKRKVGTVEWSGVEWRPERRGVFWILPFSLRC